MSRGGEAGVFNEFEDGLMWGDGNIDNDPLFANLASGNYRLSCTSPCINTGDPDASSSGGFPEDSFDADDNGNFSDKTPDLSRSKRILGVTGSPRIDMGAYESHGLPDCAGDVDGNLVVDIDDLLDVINNWGLSGAADVAPACSGDGSVNIDDLLVVINNWGCTSPGYQGGSPATIPSSIEDCMDLADANCLGDPDCWAASCQRCIAGLCQAELIDCD
jgi:hypothetical protein